MNNHVSSELAKLLKEKDEQFDVTSTLDYPTIAEVVMWLYKKHKVWINVGGDCNFKFKFEIHTWNWYALEQTYRLGHTVLGESFWDTSSKPFDSPEKAYEEAIKYVLEKLIKNEQSS